MNIQDFWEQYPGWTVVTEMTLGEKQIYIRAVVRNAQGRVIVSAHWQGAIGQDISLIENMALQRAFSLLPETPAQHT